jgi:hypothetical protein
MAELKASTTAERNPRCPAIHLDNTRANLERLIYQASESPGQCRIVQDLQNLLFNM